MRHGFFGLLFFVFCTLTGISAPSLVRVCQAAGSTGCRVTLLVFFCGLGHDHCIFGGGPGPIHTASAPTPIHRPLRFFFCCRFFCVRLLGSRPNRALMCFFHPALSFAFCTSSSKVAWRGASMKRFPPSCASCCALAAIRTSRPSFMRSIWPSQTALLLLMSLQSEYVHDTSRASSTLVFPVNLCKHPALAPLSILRVFALKFHASLP